MGPCSCVPESRPSDYPTARVLLVDLIFELSSIASASEASVRFRLVAWHQQTGDRVATSKSILLAHFESLRDAYLLLGIALHPCAVASERRVALVIGNANYLTVPRLKNPENDARAVTDKLREAELMSFTSIISTMGVWCRRYSGF